MNKRQELIDAIGEAMMGFRGYEKGKYPLEWDPDSKDSQLSMVLEDVEFVVEELTKRGYLSLNNNYYAFSGTTFTSGTTTPTVTVSTSSASTAPRESKAKTSVAIEMTTGHAPTVEDLMNFTERVQRLNVDPETSLHGSLRLMLELPDTFVDRIDCGECGVEDFLVYSDEHPCND